MALPKWATDPGQDAKNQGDVPAPTPKVCAVCGIDFLAYGFGKGRRKYCSESCYRDARKAQDREQYYKDPDRSREQWTKSNLRSRAKAFGITVEQYEQMLAAQAGGCAICGEPCKSGKRLAIDHDHVTGVVRGLLCINCNQAIGKLRDDPAILRRAIAYLEVPR